MYNASRYANLGTKYYKEDNVQFGNAGQDAWAIYQFPDEPVLAVIVADGHGKYGHIYSKLTISKALESLRKVTTDLVITKDYQIGLFNKINTYLNNFMIHKIGGTTCSFVIIKKEDNISKVYLSYVGDSPIYVKVDGVVQLIGGDDSWDNKGAIERYLFHCKKNQLKPKRVIYSRINAIGGQDYSPWGIHGVVPVYDYDMETCTISLNYDNYLKIARLGFPHGIQRLEKYPTHKETHNTHWGTREIDIADPGYENSGWGNTLEGILQMRTSIGDYHVKNDTPCDPIFKTYSFESKSIFPNPIQIGVMSDGWDDLGNPYQVIDLLNKTKEVDTIQAVTEYIRTINPDRHSEFIDGMNFKHDDTTAILVES